MNSFREQTHRTHDGAEIAYRVREGRDPWVLLHALACDSTLWDEVVRALSQDVGLVVPEMRGHGGSTPGWELPSIDRFAADVLEILEVEKIVSPGVAGVSMGGYVALGMGALAPRIARRWVFVSCHARAEDDDGRTGRALALGLVDRQGWSGWVEPAIPRWTASRQHDKHLEGMAGRAGDSGLTLALLALANRPDRRDVLPRLTQPVTAVWGELDPITQRTWVAEIAEGVPHGRLVVVPAASHLVPLDAPGALAELLR